MCAPGRASRNAFSVGNVKIKSPIAPPRITRIRFMSFAVALLYERRPIGTTVIDRRYKFLIPRKRKCENGGAIEQRDAMHQAPAYGAACAPVDLIAKQVRGHDPEQ